MSNFARPNTGEWTSDICGCFSDLESCLLGTFCPSILVGRNAEILDQGATTRVSLCTLPEQLQPGIGAAVLHLCGRSPRRILVHGVLVICLLVTFLARILVKDENNLRFITGASDVDAQLWIPPRAASVSKQSAVQAMTLVKTLCCCFEGGSVYCCIQALTSGGCGFLYTFGYRARLRQKFGLPASPYGDCLTDFCNPHCSVCQVYRELKNRGINPELGYENVRHIYDQPPQPPLQQKMATLNEAYKL